MFGDHQPSVEQAFLDKAYGVTQAEMTMEQYMGKYRTPFVIWANYPLEEEGPEETSLNFLGQYLLRYAGIETDPYGQFLWSLQKTIPALTFVGYNRRPGERLQPSGGHRLHRKDRGLSAAAVCAAVRRRGTYRLTLSP